MDFVKQITNLCPEGNDDSKNKNKLPTFNSRNSSRGGYTKHKKPGTASSTESGHSTSASKTQAKPTKSTIVKSPRKEQRSSNNMSDWGDEEPTEVIGKGFGNISETFKSDAQNEENNNNHFPKRSFNGGRGGKRGGGRYRYDNRENGDNAENYETNGDGGERFGGFRGRGRGRGGGRGGGGGGGGGGGSSGDDGRGGGRRTFNNDKGDRDDYNKRGGRENGREGEEPQKPREFYIPPEPTENEEEIFGSGITSGINFSKYDSIPVKVTGENAPAAIQSFEEAHLRDIVLNNVKRSGYKTPTPIQKTAIPVVGAGRDLMACAQTGSGKTAAFLLPIINSLLSEGAEVSIGKPHAIIVSPTRELAIQIFEEGRKFAMGSFLKICKIYGGTSSKHQAEGIGRTGCHIVVSTPGRLIDFMEKGLITFEDIRFVVLDEADRMLDMGFKENVATIMNHPTMRAIQERQNLMFSATFPEEIQRMAGEYLNEYIFIAVGVVGGACSDVQQTIYEVKKFQKRAKLREILKESPVGTLIFVENKRGADFLASILSETEFPSTSMHGDRLQSQREMALADFKSGKMHVMVATSVLARGIDMKVVNHVINYDMPSTINDYVHRIGRTGRLGNCGRSTSFFDPDYDYRIAADLVKILEGAGQEVPDFLRNYTSGGGNGADFGRKFGGRDVRKGIPQTDDNFITSAGPSALEEDEEWN